MKTKNYLLILLAIVGLALTGCTKENPNFITKYYEIHPGDWELSSDGKYFYVTLNVPEITPYIVNSGTITVSCIVEGDKWAPLPKIYPESEPLVEDPSKDYYWYFLVDYEWYDRTVDIYITPSDFATAEELMPKFMKKDMNFQVSVFYK